MTKKYAEPRYHKKRHPGRKRLAPDNRRQLIAARVAPETFKFLKNEDLKLGLLIDQLVRFKQILRPELIAKLGRETIDFDAPEILSPEFDPIIEQARGLLALMVERGTTHLSQDQIDILSDNFTLLLNNYLATFKSSKTKNSL